MANLSKIKAIAKLKGMTLGHLCKEVGITPQQLSYIMRENVTTIDALGHSTGAKVTAVYVDYSLRKVDEAVERMERWVLCGEK